MHLLSVFGIYSAEKRSFHNEYFADSIAVFNPVFINQSPTGMGIDSSQTISCFFHPDNPDFQSEDAPLQAIVSLDFEMPLKLGTIERPIPVHLKVTAENKTKY